jgi:hypothetical protein
MQPRWKFEFLYFLKNEVESLWATMKREFVHRCRFASSAHSDVVAQLFRSF